MFNLPMFIRFYFETIISLIRIETFLCYKENDNKQIECLPKDSEYAIIIDGVDFGVEDQIRNNKRKNSDSPKREDENAKLKIVVNYDNKIDSNEKNLYAEEEELVTLLTNINFKIKKGEHIGIIGEVGSGKTCLINSILNYLDFIPKLSNHKNIYNIVNGTIQ